MRLWIIFVARGDEAYTFLSQFKMLDGAFPGLGFMTGGYNLGFGVGKVH